MTEETIKKVLAETRKQVLSAEYHYEIAAKQIIEQHEAEMVEFAEWLHQSEWQFSNTKNHFDKKAGRLVNGVIIKTINSADLLPLFKNRNK